MKAEVERKKLKDINSMYKRLNYIGVMCLQPSCPQQKIDDGCRTLNIYKV